VVLVTTLDESGRPNVSTKSWISMTAFGPPPVIMFGCNLEHATARNALHHGEFVVNVPGDDLATACWAIGTDASVTGEARFAANGLNAIPGDAVSVPRVAECRAHLECELEGHRTWGDEVAIFGRVKAVSVDAALLEDRRTTRYAALAPFFFLAGRLMGALGEIKHVGKPTD